MKKRLIFLIVTLILIFSLVGCKNTDDFDSEENFGSESEQIISDSVEIISDYIDGNLPMPAMSEIHLHLPDTHVELFEEKNCAAVYNDQNIWIFDYELSRVTPMVYLDEMIERADPTGRGRPYFDSVTIDYTFRESHYCIGIDYHVRSTDNSESSFKLGSQYRTMPVEGANLFRGDHRGYTFYDIVYPDCDEPLSVNSVDELEKLYPNISPNYSYVEMIKSFVANDITALEDMYGLPHGTLSAWEGMIISDYTVTREMPLNKRGYYSMELTIENSSVSRFPDGRYKLNSGSRYMPGGYDLERLDGKDFEYTLPADMNEKAVEWALSWGTRYGGNSTCERQDPEESGFAHSMLDYLLGIADANGVKWEAFTGNMYREYAEKYLGFTGFNNEYTAYGDNAINHGGHGPNITYGEISDYRCEDGVHYVTVNSYADPFRSVIGQTHIYAMTEVENGIYALVDTEFVYESELNLMGWAV